MSTDNKTIEQEAAERYPFRHPYSEYKGFNAAQQLNRDNYIRSKEVSGRTAADEDVSFEVRQPTVSSTISEGQGEEIETLKRFTDKIIQGGPESCRKYIDLLESQLSEGTAKSSEKNQNKNEGYTRESGEMDKSSEKNNNILGTAKGGEEGIFLSNAEITKLKEEHFQLTQKIEQLSSQEAKAIADAYEEGFKRATWERAEHDVRVRWQPKPKTQAEYLSQFSSTSSPVKE